MLDEEMNSNGEEERPTNSPPPRSNQLDKSQKIAVAVLAVFGFLIIIFWTAQFKKSLSDPFTYKGEQKTNTEEQKSACQGPNCPAREAELRAKDTDQDKLSDWDELNVYHTSAYIPDSDSDGIDDGAEVNKGSDPNCPTGKDCNSSLLTEKTDSLNNSGNSTLDPSLNSSLNRLQTQGTTTPSNTQNSTPGTANNETVQKLMSGQIDVQTLRQILLDNGMQKEMLDKISDEELMKSFGEVMGGMQ